MRLWKYPWKPAFAGMTNISASSCRHYGESPFMNVRLFLTTKNTKHEDVIQWTVDSEEKSSSLRSVQLHD